MTNEELIKRIKRYLCETSADDIEKALRRIEQSTNAYELERKRVERTEDVKESKLFDVPVEDAIAYLKTFNGKHILEQRWSGYEDNYFVVSYKDFENDGEYACRITDLVSEELDKINKEDEEGKRKKAKIAQLEKELAELKSDVANAK